jgi:hypothetical protein
MSLLKKRSSKITKDNSKKNEKLWKHIAGITVIAGLFASIVVILAYFQINPNDKLKSGEFEIGINIVVDNDFSKDSLNIPWAFRKDKISLFYNYIKYGDHIDIFPNMKYLDLINTGGPVQGYLFTPLFNIFNLQYPKLSIKSVNNTNNTILLYELELEIKNNIINQEPFLLIGYDVSRPGILFLRNEGWGNLYNVEVNYGITNIDNCVSDFKDEITESHYFEIIEHSAFIGIEKVDYFDYYQEPVDLSQAWKCVIGNIIYENEYNEQNALKFYTRLPLTRGLDATPIVPSYYYDTFISAGVTDTTIYIPIAQELKPGESDNFAVRVGTDKSAIIDFNLKVKTINDDVIYEKPIKINILVPRVQMGYGLIYNERWGRRDK